MKFTVSWMYVLGALLMLWGPGAFAAPAAAAKAVRPSVRSLAQTLEGEAKAAYDSGRILFQRADYAGAALKFQQSYDLQSDPRLLWNIVACEEKRHQYVRVRELTLAFLAEGKSEGVLTPADEVDANALLAALGPLIGTVVITVNVAEAQINVDGEPVGLSPLSAPLSLDIGRRTFNVSKAGFRPFSATHDIAGGTPLEINVKLAPSLATLEVGAPVDAVIALDGKVVGQSQWRGEVMAGKHVLRVTGAGPAHEQELILNDAETRSVHVEFEPARKRAWLWPAVAAGVVASVVAGFLILRDDEQAQTTGTLGRVGL